MAKQRPGAPIGLRLRELRIRLGWSQDALAEGSGLRRTEISVIERGGNKGGSWRVRMWLARGFGAPFETLNAYWDAELGLEEIVGRIEATGATRCTAAEASTLPVSRQVRLQVHPSAPPPDYFLLFPNLDLATRLLTRDSGLGSDVVRKAALRVAIEYGAEDDRETLTWGARPRRVPASGSGRRVTSLARISTGRMMGSSHTL